MFRFTRRTALAAVATLALSACGSASDKQPATLDTPTGAGTAAIQEMILGDPNAPVTLLEYASWTCPACLDFEKRVMPMLKTDYIETGKIRYVFREFPTPPVEISVAGFAIARCAGPDKYYDVLEELFQRQPGILSMARQGNQVKAALVQIAENHGIADESAFDACLADTNIRTAIKTSISRGDASGVNSTPTVFVNGVMLEGAEWRYPEGMKVILDEALGIDPVAPEAEDTPTETVSE